MIRLGFFVMWIYMTLFTVIVISTALSWPYTALFDTNRYGERWADIIMLSVMWLWGTWALVMTLKKGWQRDKG